MKNKISKIFLALFSVFLLVGGGIFSACGKEQPQATIEVSSSDFAGDDYIEIDLGSSINTATTIKIKLQPQLFMTAKPNQQLSL